jgi:hypothetical protein
VGEGFESRSLIVGEGFESRSLIVGEGFEVSNWRGVTIVRCA